MIEHGTYYDSTLMYGDVMTARVGTLIITPDDVVFRENWTCAYCGQSNAAEREGCRGCLAPRPELA